MRGTRACGVQMSRCVCATPRRSGQAGHESVTFVSSASRCSTPQQTTHATPTRSTVRKSKSDESHPLAGRRLLPSARREGNSRCECVADRTEAGRGERARELAQSGSGWGTVLALRTSTPTRPCMSVASRTTHIVKSPFPDHDPPAAGVPRDRALVSLSLLRVTLPAALDRKKTSTHHRALLKTVTVYNLEEKPVVWSSGCLHFSKRHPRFLHSACVASHLLSAEPSERTWPHPGHVAGFTVGRWMLHRRAGRAAIRQGRPLSA